MMFVEAKPRNKKSNNLHLKRRVAGGRKKEVED